MHAYVFSATVFFLQNKFEMHDFKQLNQQWPSQGHCK